MHTDVRYDVTYLISNCNNPRESSKFTRWSIDDEISYVRDSFDRHLKKTIESLIWNRPVSLSFSKRETIVDIRGKMKFIIEFDFYSLGQHPF